MAFSSAIRADGRKSAVIPIDDSLFVHAVHPVSYTQDPVHSYALSSFCIITLNMTIVCFFVIYEEGLLRE